MSKAFLDRLFEPFAREKMFSDKRMQGTGLGMAIVLQRVHSMNGDISVDSSLGVGTTVTVSLPFERYTEEDAENDRQALLPHRRDVRRGEADRPVPGGEVRRHPDHPHREGPVLLHRRVSHPGPGLCRRLRRRLPVDQPGG